jgi:hypothetical protein
MRKRFVLPALAILSTSVLASAGPVPDPPACVRAAAWVRAHRGELPATLAALSRHPIPYRRAIYAALPSEARASLWREHLAGFVAPASELNDAQRAAVHAVMRQLPALTAPDADGDALHALERRLGEIFAPSLGARVFAVLGPAAGPGSDMDCDCAVGSMFTCGGKGSVPCAVSMECVVVPSRCGFMWGFDCDGVCGFPPTLPDF